MDIMSTTDISISFSDDQLSVALPSESRLTNGLDLATPTVAGGRQTTPDHLPSSAIPLECDVQHPPAAVVSTTHTSQTLKVAVSQKAPLSPTTRFKVQPASTAQSMAYSFDLTTSPTSVISSTSTTSASANCNSSATPDDLTGTDNFGIEESNKKKVSFPDGQALIKGFAHAPNPWYNVSLCTTDNLVSAYVNSCNAHSVRPLPKLINQLNCIRDFGERINLLTLKGEHLNSKHIETLEEIFRRVQFNTVDVESTHLDDESAIALFEMVEYYESVIHLKISYNRNLGLRAWLSAARMIRKTQHLESIDIRGCSLNEQCIAALGRALRMGAYIHAIYMQECSLSCRGVMIISAALRTIPTIKELHIGDNNLQPSDGIQLGNLVRNNTFLHTLDIRNNHLQDIGIAHICDGLAEQPNGIGLKSLNISNNHFSPATIHNIAVALSRTKSLNTLNISYNNITNEGFFLLKEGLLKNKSLCRLSLRSTKISDEGAVALAEYIADSYTISQLDLRDNDIKTAGLLAVSMCLKVHQTITRLEIDTAVKKEHAVKDYSTQQRYFLDEIQSQVAQNGEIQRAKLDRLLVQSKSEKATGIRTSVTTETTISFSTTPASTTATVTTETSIATTRPTTSNPAPVVTTEATGSYFDPLGAVSITESDDAGDRANEPSPPPADASCPSEMSVRRGDSIEAVSLVATKVLTVPMKGISAINVQGHSGAEGLRESEGTIETILEDHSPANLATEEQGCSRGGRKTDGHSDNSDTLKESAKNTNISSTINLGEILEGDKISDVKEETAKIVNIPSERAESVAKYTIDQMSEDIGESSAGTRENSLVECNSLQSEISKESEAITNTEVSLSPSPSTPEDTEAGVDTLADDIECSMAEVAYQSEINKEPEAITNTEVSLSPSPSTPEDTEAGVDTLADDIECSMAEVAYQSEINKEPEAITNTEVSLSLSPSTAEDTEAGVDTLADDIECSMAEVAYQSANICSETIDGEQGEKREISTDIKSVPDDQPPLPEIIPTLKQLASNAGINQSGLGAANTTRFVGTVALEDNHGSVEERKANLMDSLGTGDNTNMNHCASELSRTNNNMNGDDITSGEIQLLNSTDQLSGESGTLNAVEEMPRESLPTNSPLSNSKKESSEYNTVSDNQCSKNDKIGLVSKGEIPNNDVVGDTPLRLDSAE